jgi:hypothetical protein
MPTTNTITTFWRFVPGYSTVAAELSANFSNFKEHCLPILEFNLSNSVTTREISPYRAKSITTRETSSAADLMYDLGSESFKWRNAYVTEMINMSETNEINGIEALTSGAQVNLIIDGDTIASFDRGGYKRRWTLSGAVSISDGTYSVPHTVTGLIVTMTCSTICRPMMFELITADNLGTLPFVDKGGATSTGGEAYVQLVRQTTAGGAWFFFTLGTHIIGYSCTFAEVEYLSFATTFRWYDFAPTRSTCAYQIYVYVGANGFIFNMANVKLLATEL